MVARPIFNRHMRRGKSADEKKDWIQRTLQRQGIPPISDWEPDAPPVPARIDDNRWIADCPEEMCSGSEFVDWEWPYFVCLACGSGAYEVTFPAQREAIEAELMKRPNPGNRWWSPGETVADLRRENKKRGIK